MSASRALPSLALPLLCGLMLLASAPATRAEITSLSTTQLTTGTVLVIDGIDLGVTKPKVRLLPIGESGNGKTVKLKVLQHVQDRIDAVLKKAAAGEYAVEVTPKGGDPCVAADSVFVVLPQVIAVSPDNAQPGDEIEVIARHLGTKKGAITVGGRKAKVVAWETDVPDLPMGATDRARFVLSKNAKKTTNGPNPLRLRNRIGEVEAEVDVNLTGGALFLYRALLDGKPWSAVTKIGLPGYDPNGLGGIALMGFNGKPGSKKSRTVQFAIDGFDPASFGGDLPHTIEGPVHVAALVSQGVGPNASIWQSDIVLPDDGGPIITITEIADGMITGFGEALGLTGINGQAVGTTLDVTEFEFSIPMIPQG